MIKHIRTSKASKVIALYLALMMILEIAAPMQAYALTGGPSQPEFNSFTPIGSSDMVNLASGDLNYNIPIMDVGGYPINLAYDSGVTMDQEATWVGLGWNLNVGQINRQVRGLPDDFKGDEMVAENNMKTNVTVGVNPYVNFQLLGSFDNASLGAGLNVQYNNYSGITATPSFGLSFNVSKYVTLGMNLTSSSTEGVSVTPSASLHTKKREACDAANRFEGSISPSIAYNSRQGLQSFNLSSSISATKAASDNQKDPSKGVSYYSANAGSTSGRGSISLLDNTFTPSKRLAYNNTSGTFSFSIGPDVWSAHAEFSISASVGVQKLKDQVTRDNAYGYEYTDAAPKNSLLDFNREKEQGMVSKNTKVLPITNYTYDIYNIQGQGVNGMFRPYRGQVGYVYDAKIEDISNSLSLGAEIEGGGGVHVGASITYSPSRTYTGSWDTQATPFFDEKGTNNTLDYERSYFKMIGENRTDDEYKTLLVDKLGDAMPITLKLDANKNATNGYWKKTTNGSTSGLTSIANFTTPIKRSRREKRNQLIQKITKKEAKILGVSQFINNNDNAKDHHTLGYIVTDENGSRNIFGETAYNTTKREVSFAVRQSPDCNNTTGIIQYDPGDNTVNNQKGTDHFFNRETTPAYAHTYLLSSTLSNDYEDVTGNGPTDDDMGGYTKFEYRTYDNDYRWRIPYMTRSASYNEGYKTLPNDQKASYLYGAKELKYVQKIITKTHVAFFDLETRKDGLGVAGENGGGSYSQRMYKIKSIRLYSKPEVLVNGVVTDPGINSAIKPIKTAHFVYDYSLCKKVDNNTLEQTLTDNEIPTVVDHQIVNNSGGKLTLKKVYFTYKDSNMGKYTPYIFHYDSNFAHPDSGTLYDTNPDYNPKNYDIWGNYMPNFQADCNDEHKTSPQEFPYVEQNTKAQQDVYASSWTLTSIQLPSGGLIKMEYESDDYKYVQNRQAMRMFKVEGVSYDGSTINNTQLYNGNNDASYVVIACDAQTDIRNFKQRYIGNLIDKPIFFNFFVNLANGKSDYVQGYFKIKNAEIIFNENTKRLFIPMQMLNREGKDSNTNLVNPISLAGWYFGRQYMNREIYGQPSASDGVDIVTIARSLANNLGAMAQLFTGPNGHLRDTKGCARYFNPYKSWIRLLEPDGIKLGGGSRVKQVLLYDAWETMLGIDPGSPILDRYKKKYGQDYSYGLEDGTSSGVATYEPNVSKENPFVEPFYHNAQNMISPAAVSYIEKPFGESFYPSATVTYSRVSVKNVPADGQETQTGKVVTKHYTSYDFPTITDYTTLDSSNNNPNKTSLFESNEDNVVGNMLSGMLGLPVIIKTDLTMSQGFSIQTNDMNGKLKKQEVYNQTDNLISSVEYKYSTKEGNSSILENELTTVDKTGKNTKKTIGVHYDVINDFRENFSNSKTFGINVNVDMIPIGFIPIIIGMGVPENADHTQILRTAVTTKIIHRTGILKEKIAFDLGSRVSTKNLAWDAQSGQVLLTETINEFDDKYYSFNYPAYWFYNGMGMASENADIRGFLIANAGTGSFVIPGITATQMSNYLKPGDELVVATPFDKFLNRVWVESLGANGAKLMKRNGTYVPTTLSGMSFRIIRSGLQNMQMAKMASVTSMVNPLGVNNNNDLNFATYDYTTSQDPLNWRVLNASAIEYSDSWASQCENGLPRPVEPTENPFIYNMRGEWRPYRSYNYLTTRNYDKQSTRLNGFYTRFRPVYRVSNQLWSMTLDSWTFTSKVVKYSPYGVEIENKDALKRYSSAQYGYNYKLPVAVASNTRYKEIGYDGFEDYFNVSLPSELRPHFGFSEYLNAHAKVTDKTSHTGKRSIELKPLGEVKLIRTIEACGYKDEDGDDDTKPH